MVDSLVRHPAVAGQFYPANPDKLRSQIASFITQSKKIPAKGIMVPHAGYMYSGGVAGKVYSQVEIPNRLIILSPNHTGLGSPFSMMDRGEWQLPFGNVQIDHDLADKFKKEFSHLRVDPLAHIREHSLEVQLPFLQFLKEDFRFVPITVGHVRYELCREFGEAIANVVKREKTPILIIASTDMNHFEEHNRTLKKDRLAIDEILKKDPQSLYRVVHEEDISMCGIIPVTIMLTACNKLGIKKVTLVDHKTSGDITGDNSSVVGYAGVIVE